MLEEVATVLCVDRVEGVAGAEDMPKISKLPYISGDFLTPT